MANHRSFSPVLEFPSPVQTSTPHSTAPHISSLALTILSSLHCNMHILCTICSDLVNQADNIYVTKCGHIFHFLCLSQWIERSESCPQCRNKVTKKCMFRLYPTICNESSSEDVATLRQSLDDALLQLRQQKAIFKEQTDKIKSIEDEMKNYIDQLKVYKNKLETRDTAIAAMKEQVQYLKEQNKEVEKLKEENETLKKNIQTLNGLQKVLNASSEEVEQMLEGYSDVRTVATFATALKRALCESERKKNDTRDRLQAAKQKLSAEKTTVAILQAQIAIAEEKLVSVMKRKHEGGEAAAPADTVKRMKPDLNSAISLPDSCDISYNSMVNKIENAESPYLRLQQSSLALSALSLARPPHPAKALPNKSLKPSEYALLNSARNAVTMKQETSHSSKTGHGSKSTHSSKTSIFQTKPKIQCSQETDPNLAFMNISYDGLGGHSKVETFPVPIPKPKLPSLIPKLSAKHKLKRPNPVGSQNIKKMFEKINPED